ncbi:MAG: tail fiber protein [Methylobacter sp.]|jgi:microcystin-dependent protein|nr:tail fiber protein [Methylobacter sp.]
MAQPYIGEIRLFAGNYAPLNWMFCEGQLLAIVDYDILFALIGTTYGGDGQNTFALPDLRGRAPLHQSNSFSIGVMGGAENETLTVAQIPSHSHNQAAYAGAGTRSTATHNFIAAPLVGTALAKAFHSASNTTMATGGLAAAGSNQAHNNMQPYLCINYIISLTGTFPQQT